MIAPKDNTLEKGSPPPFLPPRPLYFEPEDDVGCPACRAGGVCGCVLFTPVIT